MPGNCKSKQGLDPNSLGAVFAPCSLLEVECVKARDASRSQSLMGSSDMERILEYHFDANLAADERKNHRFFGWESNQRMDVTASVQYKDLRTRYWRPTRLGVQTFNVHQRARVHNLQARRRCLREPLHAQNARKPSRRRGSSTWSR